MFLSFESGVWTTAGTALVQAQCRHIHQTHCYARKMQAARESSWTFPSNGWWRLYHKPWILHGPCFSLQSEWPLWQSILFAWQDEDHWWLRTWCPDLFHSYKVMLASLCIRQSTHIVGWYGESSYKAKHHHIQYPNWCLWKSRQVITFFFFLFYLLGFLYHASTVLSFLPVTEITCTDHYNSCIICMHETGDIWFFSLSPL